ncbi:hypothetical protein [Neisseria sicca]|nr:hypothetical protein [Neisseria sicca]
MSKYTLHFKYQAVLHYLHIRSQQRTADHYCISRTHLPTDCLWPGFTI